MTKLSERIEACTGDTTELAAEMLTEDEMTVLRAWKRDDPEFSGRSFKDVASEIDMDATLVPQIVRSLARKGMTKFSRGMWTEDGQMYGSGYALTEAGAAILSAERKEEVAALVRALEVSRDV